MLSVVERHRDRIDLDTIAPSANWRETSSNGQKAESSRS